MRRLGPGLDLSETVGSKVRKRTMTKFFCSRSAAHITVTGTIVSRGVTSVRHMTYIADQM